MTTYEDEARGLMGGLCGEVNHDIVPNLATLQAELNTARAELDEANAEIARHRRDFAKISNLVHDALNRIPGWDHMEALRAIRGIVG